MKPSQIGGASVEYIRNYCFTTRAFLSSAMPKSAKKRKAKVADFVKPKFKLGTAKRPPSNAIDTSFKARSIALPVQSIATERDQSIPTTKRKLAFDNLVSLVKHHNAGTRRDSILGFRELFEEHPDLIQQSLGSLLQACAKVIGDEDASVRKALLSFLTWILPKIPQEVLIPHSTILLLFTSSAQTHIFPEIRLDAVRFLDLYLEYFPGLLVEGWTEGGNCHGGRILEGYLGMLNASIIFDDDPQGSAKATSTLTVTLSPTSKMIVMQSLSTFLRCALSDSGTSGANDTTFIAKAWYLASSFPNSNMFRSFHELFSPKSRASPVSCSWRAGPDTEEDFVQKFDFAMDPLQSCWTLQQLSDVANVKGDTDLTCDTQDAFVARLARALHPVLISTFLDYAPSAFSPNGPSSEVELKLVVATCEIMQSLYSAILQAPNIHHDKACENLRTMLRYMAAYFPFRLTGPCDIKMETALQNLNIVFCQLTSFLILSSENTSSSKQGPPNASKQETKPVFSPQVKQINEHVVQLLRGESGLPYHLKRPLTLEGYNALSPTIWSLLNNKSSGNRLPASDVLGAVIEHAIKTPSKSAVKAATIEFVGRLILMEIEHSYKGIFKLEQYTDKIADMREWILHLLKTLWELGNSNMQCTEIILLFLLRLFQRNPYLVNSELVVAVRSRLTPYFFFTHLVQGQLPGPFGRLPSRSVRRLALDVASLVLDPRSNDGLEGVIEQSVAGTEEQSYWYYLRSSCCDTLSVLSR